MIARVYDGRTGEWTEQPVPEVVHDDITRTVTTTSPDGQVTTRDYTPAENRSADAAIADAATLADHGQRLARIEAHLWPAPPDPTSTAGVPTMADYEGIWPADGLLLDGGKVWRNITTVPLTTAPSGFPGATSQWSHLFVEVTVIPPTPTAPAWSGASVAYKVGDLVTYSGVVYRCLQAHTSQAGWTPPAVASLWAVA